jgi:flagellar P-ring protein precursor FlgI
MRLTPLLLVLALAGNASAASVRIKDVTDVEGLRTNALFGYGLVVGLGGTGDTESSFFTSQTVAGMLGRLGVRIDPSQVRVRNVAAVMVTATLPTFARAGSRLDVSVSSLGNARSLEGGVLLATPLQGADGEVHALGQGAVQSGGYAAGDAGASLRKNQPTSGRVPSGATIERAVSAKLDGPLVLQLKEPDATTATRLAQAINDALGKASANALDPGVVVVAVPVGTSMLEILARVEGLSVEVDRRAKVVVSERTGTVVAGEGVHLNPVVVAHGGIEVAITRTQSAGNAAPFAPPPPITNNTSANAREQAGQSVALPATATVQDLAKALNLLGASPRDLVSILQAIKSAGGLDAELEVQ